jgi:hypothetical protein
MERLAQQSEYDYLAARFSEGDEWIRIVGTIGISFDTCFPSVEIWRSYMSGERKNTVPGAENKTLPIPTLALSSIYTEPRTNETHV